MTVGPRSGEDRTTGSRETVAAVDEVDGRPCLVVADIARDGAWVAVAQPAALELDAWA